MADSGNNGLFQQAFIDAAPVGSLIHSASTGVSGVTAAFQGLGSSMVGLPPLNLTGGAAGQSNALGGKTGANLIYAPSGGGGLLWVSIAALIGLVIWKHHRK